MLSDSCSLFTLSFFLQLRNPLFSVEGVHYFTLFKKKKSQNKHGEKRTLCAAFWFLGGSDGKASACNVGDPGSIPGLGRSSGEGNGNPLQYSCLENSMDGGAWWATVHGVTKSWTWLSNFTIGSWSEDLQTWNSSFQENDRSRSHFQGLKCEWIKRR